MIKIMSPTYRRAVGKSTHLYIPSLTYVVSIEEKDEYLASKEHDNFWFVPPEAQGNKCRILNYILDNCDEDQVLLIDDDHREFKTWLSGKRSTISNDDIMTFIENMFQMCDDADIRFWGVSPHNDNFGYDEYTPFSLTSYIGGPWMGMNRCDLRFDERVSLKDDYDMTLQVLNKYRMALRCNWFIYQPKQHTNKGGCSHYRNIKKEQEQLQILQKKWGKKIISDGTSSAASKSKVGKGSTKETVFDINPILRCPIKGV